MTRNPPRNPRTKQGRARRKRLRWALLLLLIPVLFFSAMVLLGPPEFVLRAISARLERQGLHVEIRQAYYRPVRGIVLRDVKVFSPRDLVTPWISVDTVQLRPGWRRKLRGGPWSAKMQIIRGTVQTELGMWADDFVTQQPLLLRGLDIDLYVQEDLLRLHHLHGRIGDIRLQVSGEFPLGPMSGEPPQPREAWGPAAARTLAQVVGKVEDFTFSPLALCEVKLAPDPDPEQRLRADVNLTFHGAGSHLSFPFQHFELEGDYANETLSLHTFVLDDGQAQYLTLSGHIDFAREMASLHVRNTLPRDALEHLAPISLTRILENLSLRVEGRADVDFAFGPSRFENFGRHFHGRLDVGDAFYRDAFFPRVAMDIAYYDRVLSLKNFKGEVGHGRLHGPVSGRLAMDLESGRLDMGFESGFNPIAVISLLQNDVANQWVREWEFQEQPPEITFSVFRERRGAPMMLDLDFEARNVVGRGTYFEKIRGRLHKENQVVQIRHLEASRNEEVLNGRMRYDLDQKELTLDMESTFRIHDLAPLFGEEAVQMLRAYRIRGSNWVRAQGTLDFSEKGAHALEGKAAFHDVVWQWMNFNELSFSFHVRDQTVDFPDIHAQIQEGRAEGNLLITDVGNAAASRFELNLGGADIDLFETVTAATDSTDTPYTGTLFFDFKLAGLLHDPPEASRFDSYEGEGSLEIQEGALFRIPLLLGLSRILSKVVRGFGYAAQTNFSADVVVENGRIASDNLFLRGRLISIEGDGHLNFDRNIRANVRVQLLSEGFLSEALKVVLWPLRKLIEVRLTGTLDDPDWEPRNLPREIFGR